ncbi:MAG TPA: rhamnulokinase family protein [Candidatus Binatia bacterium]|nr:rhamnulokinase family protein [Candidatus Binatia bacterium]
MPQQTYLAVDLGAESGRVIAGVWDGKTMRMEELHRFPNGPVHVNGTMRWDVLRLWAEIQNGIAAAQRKFGGNIVSVGVDTWGVDFVLLSKSDELLGLPFHYRDRRTQGMLAKALEIVPRNEIFAATGTQFMEINSLYQLLALHKNSPELLAVADRFLMIPDFINFCLCGVKVSEFTNATTTQCVHPTKRDWTHEMLGRFNLPVAMFPEIIFPGTKLGKYEGIEVIAPATHDTASAVAAVPAQHSGKSTWAYLSSGTWSLLGVEVGGAVLSPRALELNFTNEGGVDGTYRLLKNIMGLWLVQECKRAFARNGKEFDYPELARLAMDAPPFRSLIDPDDARFLNPRNMIEAIQQYCREISQPVPESEGQIIRCVYESLALKYAKVVAWLEELTGSRVEVIHIVGGGSKNAVLNTFTANACKRPVIAGPAEATGLGNLLIQAHAHGEIGSLDDLREISRSCSELQTFTPGS